LIKIVEEEDDMAKYTQKMKKVRELPSITKKEVSNLTVYDMIEQIRYHMTKIDEIVKSRNENYLKYKNEIKNDFWSISPPNNSYISNFSYPIITKNINNLVKALSNNNIDCRPLICGSINEHPFWFERYGKSELPNSKLVHTYGIYLPNNHQITNDELDKIIETVNNNL